MPERIAAAAHELSDALDRNSSALSSIRRRFAWLWLVVAASCLSTLVSGVLALDNLANAREACARDNELRTGLLTFQGFLEDAVSPEELAQNSPETAEDVRALLDALERDFAVRDCP